MSTPRMARSDSELSSLSNLSEPAELPAPAIHNQGDVDQSAKVDLPAGPIFASTSPPTQDELMQEPIQPIPVDPLPQLSDKQYLDAIFGSDFKEADPEDMSDSSDSEDEYEDPSPDGIRRRKRIPGGRLRPAYYYPLADGRGKTSRGVPVFEPTMEEFADFYQFINRVDRYGMKAGLVKVVPPKEWKDKLPSIDDKLRATRIRDPISELMHGSSGLFKQTNISKTKTWSAKQWQKLANSPTYATPDFFNKAKKDADDGDEEKSSQRRPAKKQTPRKKKLAKGADVPASDLPPDLTVESAQDLDMPDTPIKTELDLPSPASSSANTMPPTPTTKAEASATDPNWMPEYKNKAKKSAAARAETSDEDWASFDWQTMMHDAKPEDFTVEACREIERRYWRTLTFGEPPMYGADMQGSLFTRETSDWNVANLDDLLRRLRPTQRIPGVNTPYLYFGMWRATFAWHVEDADLYSINYVHFGAPKFWYSVPQEEAERFERVMSSFFPQDRKKCSEFLRHKMYLASPNKLADQGIVLNRLVQLPGEFVLTYPRGYHSGFNVGFNCAESINFATSKWLDIGRKAKYCACVHDSVNINVDYWLAEALREAKEARLEGPLKRKRREYDEFLDAPVKRPRQIYDPSAKTVDQDAKRARKLEKDRLKREADAASVARVKSYVCALCPDTTQKSLVKLAPPHSRAASDDPRRLAGRAHKLCVMFCPTTFTARDEATGEELVHGFDNIEKARWDLKCQLCNEKHGVKVQCNQHPKCVRAHHVTCAIKEQGGAYIDAVIGHAAHQISLIESAREDGGSIFDIFDLPAPVDEADQAETLLDDALDPAPTTQSNSDDVLKPAPTKQSTSASGCIAAQPSPSKQSAMQTQATRPALPPTEISSAIEETVSSIRLVVCCRQHNPDWVKAQSKLKLTALGQRVAAIKVGSTVRVKTSGGTFQTRLVANLPERDSIHVAFEDGKSGIYKWTAICWKETGSSPAMTVTSAAPTPRVNAAQVAVQPPSPVHRNQPLPFPPQSLARPVPQVFPPVQTQKPTYSPQAPTGHPAPPTMLQSAWPAYNSYQAGYPFQASPGVPNVFGYGSHSQQYHYPGQIRR